MRPFLYYVSRITACNRRLIFVHFRRNKIDPHRRFNFDPVHARTVVSVARSGGVEREKVSQI